MYLMHSRLELRTWKVDLPRAPNLQASLGKLEPRMQGSGQITTWKRAGWSVGSDLMETGACLQRGMFNITGLHRTLIKLEA